MSVLPNEKKALSAFRDEVTRNFGALDVILFGSKARGTDTSESDLDVAVILVEKSPEIASGIDDIIFEINLEHDCLIVPIYFSHSEVTKGPMSESPIYKRIQSEGIRV